MAQKCENAFKIMSTMCSKDKKTADKMVAGAVTAASKYNPTEFKASIKTNSEFREFYSQGANLVFEDKTEKQLFTDTFAGDLVKTYKTAINGINGYEDQINGPTGFKAQIAELNKHPESCTSYQVCNSTIKTTIAKEDESYIMRYLTQPVFHIATAIITAALVIPTTYFILSKEKNTVAVTKMDEDKNTVEKTGCGIVFVW